jgi:hypothetical protein
MARPIADTPILEGEDEIRFLEAMENVKPISEERRREMEKSYLWVKAHANFYVPELPVYAKAA